MPRVHRALSTLSVDLSPVSAQNNCCSELRHSSLKEPYTRMLLRAECRAAKAESMKGTTYDQVERDSVGTRHLADGLWRYCVKSYNTLDTTPAGPAADG